MALNARPSLQLVVKLWMLTLGYLQRPEQKSSIINSTQHKSVANAVEPSKAYMVKYGKTCVIESSLSLPLLTQQFSFGTKAAGLL